MTEHMRRPAEAPRRLRPTWIEWLALPALAVVVLGLREMGTLPPDATSPMALWFLDAMRAGADSIGR